MGKLAPKINLGCEVCSKSLDFDLSDFTFNPLPPPKPDTKVTAIVSQPKIKRTTKGYKLKTLF